VPRLNNVHCTLSREQVCAYLQCMWLAVKETRGKVNVRDFGVGSTPLPVLKLNANNKFTPSEVCVRVQCANPGAVPVHYPSKCLPQELDWVAKLSTAARSGGWTIVDCDAAFGTTPTAGDQLFKMLGALGVAPFVVPRKVRVTHARCCFIL
jgi:hypothetical protein